ncbi:Phage integrase family protein [Natronobacterium texcoconense]|uniref:Phage integrase family protein n=1 Tax=Natronobacterium texcoconense TaxID=1095778 RepID=A0A1H1HMB0_NATTX|nr:Phage integrase family protein [Natronobacterium texcoconense]
MTDLTPSDALSMYLSERQSELAASTVKSIRSRIGMFVDWCDDRDDIETLDDVQPMHLHQYKLHNVEQGIADKTVLHRLNDVVNLLEWAAAIDCCDDSLADRLRALQPNADSSRDRILSSERASDILDYLERFNYAQRHHVVILLLWSTGIRLGALRSIDVSDVILEPTETDVPYISLSHRPETDTPLKNGTGGERHISLKESTATVIGDYLSHHRDDVTDDYGRRPLVTTQFGRPSVITVRRTVYRYTRPCEVSKDCPHGEHPSECKAATDNDYAAQCPSVVSPHDVRRGAITYLCRNDVPETVVSDRCDVSPDVIDKHYNQMTECEKMEKRRGYLENI